MSCGQVCHKGGSKKGHDISEKGHPALSQCIMVNNEETHFLNGSEYGSNVVFPRFSIFAKTYSLFEYDRFEIDAHHSCRSNIVFHYNCLQCLRPSSDMVYDILGPVDVYPPYNIVGNEFLWCEGSNRRITTRYVKVIDKPFIDLNDLELEEDYEADVMIAFNIALSIFIQAIGGTFPFGIANLLRIADFDLILISLSYIIQCEAFARYPTYSAYNISSLSTELTSKVSITLASLLDGLLLNNTIVSRVINSNIIRVAAKRSELTSKDLLASITIALNYLTEGQKSNFFSYLNFNSTRYTISKVADFTIRDNFYDTLRDISRVLRGQTKARKIMLDSGFLKSYYVYLIRNRVCMLNSLDITELTRYKTITTVNIVQIYLNGSLRLDLSKLSSFLTILARLKKEDLYAYDEAVELGVMEAHLRAYRMHIKGDLEISLKMLAKKSGINSKAIAPRIVPLDLIPIDFDPLTNILPAISCVDAITLPMTSQAKAVILTEKDLWVQSHDPVKYANERFRTLKTSTSTHYKMLELLMDVAYGTGAHLCDGNGGFSWLSLKLGGTDLFHQTMTRFPLRDVIRDSNVPAWHLFKEDFGVSPFHGKGFSAQYGTDVLTEKFKCGFAKLVEDRGSLYDYMTIDWENSKKNLLDELTNLIRQRDFILWALSLTEILIVKIYCVSKSVLFLYISLLDINQVQIKFYAPILSSYYSKEVYLVITKIKQGSVYTIRKPGSSYLSIEAMEKNYANILSNPNSKHIVGTCWKNMFLQE